MSGSGASRRRFDTASPTQRLLSMSDFTNDTIYCSQPAHPEERLSLAKARHEGLYQ